MQAQPRLFARSAFPHPSAQGSSHYFPILQSLSGELDGLRHLPMDVRGRMTPLIEVSPEREEVDEAPRASRLPKLHTDLGVARAAAPTRLEFRRVDPGQTTAV